jgi:hypothetical protein
MHIGRLRKPTDEEDILSLSVWLLKRIAAPSSGRNVSLGTNLDINFVVSGSLSLLVQELICATYGCLKH